MNFTQDQITSDIHINSRVLTQILGSQMIQSDSIVIAEQIKNSIDANADKVTVDLSNIDNDLIVITDNGDGMSIHEIKEKWFMVGTDHKTQLDSLLGGKGIGRFGLFRLASIITVTTVQNEVQHSFAFDKYKIESDGMKNIPIARNVVQNKNSGTTITLNNLKHFIDLEEIEKGLENLNHPSIIKKYVIKYPSKYHQSSYAMSDSILGAAPFIAEIEFEGTEIVYNFSCSLKGNIVYQNKDLNKHIIDELNKTLAIRNAKESNLGSVRIELSNYYLRSEFLSWYGITANTIKDKFLDAYQGISVYRNNYKIYGHGETDWLKLAELRVQRYTDNIDNKLTYGVITLDPTKSLALEENSSREGFIDSPELTYFREMVTAIVKQFGIDRDNSREKVMEYITNSTKQNDQPKEEDAAEPIIKEKHNRDKNKDSNYNDDGKTQKQKSQTSLAINTEESKKITPISNNENKSRGKSYLTPTKIIDVSFECNPKTPEKIKQIIDELKYLTTRNINAQSLLLRSLIDISTDYFQKKKSISIVPNNLSNNIKNVLDYFNENKLMSHSQNRRVRNSVNKTQVINYFNGVAHDYEYRPNYSDLKEIWNTFEPYITVCINP